MVEDKLVDEVREKVSGGGGTTGGGVNRGHIVVLVCTLVDFV